MPKKSGGRSSRKAGLPPGTPILISSSSEKTKITVIDYDGEGVREKSAASVQECAVFGEQKTTTWINVDGLEGVELLQKLCEAFSIHPLVTEDILDTTQRPKTEDYGDYIYTVIRMLHMGEKIGEIESEQISIILGKNFVISFQEHEGDVFNAIRERIRSGKGRIRKAGADYLAYSLIDAVVDNYFNILESFGEGIETMEEELIINPTPRTLRSLHGLKRNMIVLRKSVWPMREVVSMLERMGEGKLIRKNTQIYLRDVYDHTIQVIDNVETYREMLSGMMDIYLSSISNRLNEVMKVLTIIGTIFIPLTFITGLYGMNFRYMPELESELGYPAVLVLMAVASIIMLAYFRKKKWI